MADAKVRCDGCGAKNTDPLADRCRICGALLPDAQRRRVAKVGATTAGPAFTELVESEVSAWREYSEARARSRRPADDDTAAHKVAMATGHLVMILVAALAGAGVVYLAYLALIA